MPTPLSPVKFPAFQGAQLSESGRLWIPKTADSSALQQTRQHFIPPHIQNKLEGGDVRIEKAQPYRLRRFNTLPTQNPEASSTCMKEIQVYNCEGEYPTSQAELARGHNQPPTGDDQVDTAYESAEHIFDFIEYLSSKGALPENFCLMNKPFKIYVRYDDLPHDGNSFFNAFFNEETSEFVFGHIEPESKDAQYFKPLVFGYDVFSHETGHGLIQAINPLYYSKSAGALNESIADCFGISALHYLSGHKATDSDEDWLIGASVLVDAALRNMIRPGSGYVNHPLLGSDPQPDHVFKILDPRKGLKGNIKFILETWLDNWGVHIFSGLANKPFAELTLLLGAHTYEEPLQILLTTLNEVGTTEPGLVQFARKMEDVAKRDYGKSTAKAVRKAWASTGVLTDGWGISLETIPRR